MSPTARTGRSFPVEEFVQSVSAQLDRAQDALAIKARIGRPLTFAIKDLAIDLRVFWESDASGRVLVRHAGPNEEGASTMHLAFTTITKSMVEENTVALSADPDPRSLDDLSGSKLDDEDRRRLDMIGVRTVGQLRQLSSQTDPTTVQAYLGVPILRLQAALEQAARPAVTSVQPIDRGGRPALRIMGANLASEGVPEVRLSGERVEVLEASPSALVVRPLSHHREGAVELSVDAGRATAFYALPPEMIAPEELRRPHPDLAAGAHASHAAATDVTPVAPVAVVAPAPLAASSNGGGEP